MFSTKASKNRIQAGGWVLGIFGAMSHRKLKRHSAILCSLRLRLPRKTLKLWIVGTEEQTRSTDQGKDAASTMISQGVGCKAVFFLCFPCCFRQTWWSSLCVLANRKGYNASQLFCWYLLLRYVVFLGGGRACTVFLRWQVRIRFTILSMRVLIVFVFLFLHAVVIVSIVLACFWGAVYMTIAGTRVFSEIRVMHAWQVPDSVWMWKLIVIFGRFLYWGSSLLIIFCACFKFTVVNDFS